MKNKFINKYTYWKNIIQIRHNALKATHNHQVQYFCTHVAQLSGS